MVTVNEAKSMFFNILIAHLVGIQSQLEIIGENVFFRVPNLILILVG